MKCNTKANNMNIRKLIEESVCLFFIFAFAYFLLMLGGVLGLN